MSEIHVSIDDDLKKIALEHSEERLQYEFNRFGLSLKQRKSMILIGTVGQLIFKKFLEENNIEFEFEFQAGKYDKKDFQVNGKIIEIKCSGYGDRYQHMNLLYAKDQFENGIKKKFEYCVQIFINGYDILTKMLDITKCTDGVILGFTEFTNIKNFKNPKMRYFGDYYKVPLASLKPVNELLEILK
jgi:hypothetical protein